jgi:hypothetical protein
MTKAGETGNPPRLKSVIYQANVFSSAADRICSDLWAVACEVRPEVRLCRIAFGMFKATAALRIDRISPLLEAEIAFWSSASLYTYFGDVSVLIVVVEGVKDGLFSMMMMMMIFIQAMHGDRMSRP